VQNSRCISRFRIELIVSAVTAMIILLASVPMMAFATTGSVITVGPVGYYVGNVPGSGGPYNFQRSTVPVNQATSHFSITQTPIQGGVRLEMSTDGSVGEVSSGFYFIVPQLGNINNWNITVRNYVHTGGASLVQNLWFDSSGDGEFFVWSGNVLTSLGGDVYGLGTLPVPALNSAGTYLFVNDTSTYYVICPPSSPWCNQSAQTLTVKQFKQNVENQVDSSTLTAVWIGIDNGGSAGSGSADVILNPYATCVVAAGAVKVNACSGPTFGLFSNFMASPLSIVTPPPPVGLTFPNGLYSFSVSGLNPGQTVTLTITFSSPLPPGAFSYWKFQGGAWTQLTTASLDSTGTIVTLTLTADANGKINDPGGPAITPAATTATTATTFTPVHQTPVGGVMLPSVGFSVLLPWVIVLSLLGVLSVEAFRVRRRTKRR